MRNVRSREEETDDDDSPFSHRCHRKTLVTDNSLIAQEHPLPAAVSKLFFIPISCPVVAPHKKILKHLFSSGHSPRVASQFFHPAGEKKDFFPLATIAILFCLSLYPLFCFVYHHTMTTVSYYRTGGSRQVISLSLLTLPCDCSLLSVRTWALCFYCCCCCRSGCSFHAPPFKRLISNCVHYPYVGLFHSCRIKCPRLNKIVLFQSASGLHCVTITACGGKYTSKVTGKNFFYSSLFEILYFYAFYFASNTVSTFSRCQKVFLSANLKFSFFFFNEKVFLLTIWL